MVRVRVSRLAMEGTTGANVVVLEEVGGERLLPIWIGRAEAEAIARHLEGVASERPLTHELARDLVETLGGTIREVRITHVEQNTFFAQVIVQRGADLFTVDARPSDAIALGLRFGAELFAADALLAHFPTLRDDGAPDDPGPEGDEPGILGGSEAAGDSGEVEHDGGGYQSPSASGKAEPSDLQRYLEKLRPEDFGKFRP
jgi:bifunctional DNase/RNase